MSRYIHIDDSMLWEVGGESGLTVYCGERLICECATRPDAIVIVELMNAAIESCRKLKEVCRSGSYLRDPATFLKGEL